ncbi:MAG: hypothetical protein FJ213_03325, partial [Ignavibacteria bacterium]|nr:hypothetical protein [Ignavibacteria bacterium]
MKKWLCFIILFSFAEILSSQPTEVSKFEFSDIAIVDAHPIKISENNCILVYLLSQKLYSSSTTNNGLNWT